MIVLRQGRAIPSSIAQYGHSAFPFGALRNAPLSSIRHFSLRPAWRAPPPSPFMFKRKSVSGFSTLNVHRHPLGKAQIGNPIFGTFRPQIQFSKTPRLTASLSTGAQRLLDESQEWARDLPNEISDIGDMAQLGLGLTYWPTDLIIRLLEFCHVSTELPWWGSIVLLTLVLRVALFPLMLKTTRNTAIVPYIKDKQIDLMNDAKEARASGELVEVRKATMKLMDLYKEWGYRPLLGFIGLLQLPIFIGVFRTLSRCSELPVPGWQTGGTAWFTDLTAIDPYFILPTVSGLTTAGTILFSQRDVTAEPRGILGFVQAVMPFLAIGMIPILGAYQPASVFVYWTANNFFSLLQSLLFNHPRTRVLMGIMPRPPPSPNDKVRRPGFMGFVKDRADFTKLAFKNYVKDAAERRSKISGVLTNQAGKDIKYETRKKGKADKRATAAGAVEKLK